MRRSNQRNGVEAPRPLSPNTIRVKLLQKFSSISGPNPKQRMAYLHWNINQKFRAKFDIELVLPCIARYISMFVLLGRCRVARRHRSTSANGSNTGPTSANPRKSFCNNKQTIRKNVMIRKAFFHIGIFYKYQRSLSQIWLLLLLLSL